MSEAANDNEAPRMYTTKEAAVILKTTPQGIRMRVHRGKLVPDVWGRTGSGPEHLFTLETLQKHLGQGRAA